MDQRKIRYFFSVIKNGNLSSAAQSLRVSQPTLSRQIQAIEQEFQIPLFVRGGRGMLLTEAGKQLHEGLQSIERQLRLLKTDVTAVSVEPAGEVAFGIPPSPRGLIAVPLVRQYSSDYPRVAIRLVEETSGQLRDLVANGILDLAITNTTEPTHGTVSQILGRERLVLVGPAALDDRSRHRGARLHRAADVRRARASEAEARFRKSDLRSVRDLAFGTAKIPAARCGSRALSRHSLQIQPQANRKGHLAGGLRLVIVADASAPAIAALKLVIFRLGDRLLTDIEGGETIGHGSERTLPFERHQNLVGSLERRL
jgi:DNA-binding transcriptional LysR family regulator